MRLGSVVWVLVGSVAVSAACAASRDGDSGAPRSDAGRALDAVADVVRDVLGLDTAVSDAKADGPPAPTPPTVDDVACTTEGMWSGVQPTWFAVKAYPGKTAAELARGVAIVCGIGTYPDGYCSTQVMGVKDGSVSVYCTAKASGISPSAISVRVVMP